MTTQRRSRKHPAFAAKVAEGRSRNEAWEQLSNREKTFSLAQRAGKSRRQMAKLAAEPKA